MLLAALLAAITLRDVLLVLLILAIISLFVPSWRAYRLHSGSAVGLIVVILLIVVLLD